MLARYEELQMSQIYQKNEKEVIANYQSLLLQYSIKIMAQFPHHQKLFENLVDDLAKLYEKQFKRLDIEINQLKVELDKAMSEVQSYKKQTEDLLMKQFQEDEKILQAVFLGSTN